MMKCGLSNNSFGIAFHSFYGKLSAGGNSVNCIKSDIRTSSSKERYNGEKTNRNKVFLQLFKIIYTEINFTFRYRG